MSPIIHNDDKIKMHGKMNGEEIAVPKGYRKPHSASKAIFCDA